MNFWPAGGKVGLLAWLSAGGEARNKNALRLRGVRQPPQAASRDRKNVLIERLRSINTFKKK